MLEYVWSAACVLFDEGEGQQSRRVANQKKRLLASQADLILAELHQALAGTPQTGPGNKNRRERIDSLIRYIDSNADRMNYRYVFEEDLELASGAVEGAVKHVVGYRFDQGGMR